MAIIDLIPQLDDKELSNLRSNAQRLEGSGTPQQRADAAQLLPAIEAEVAERLSRRPPKGRRTAKKDMLH
jgi:hypothetical protein